MGPQESSSSNSDEEEAAPAALEAVISGVRLSERLFFEPEETSSILRESKNGKNSKRWMFKDSVAMALESEDPYLDFKRSMEEMVESKNLLKDWDCLEELLVWYLRMNGKINHGFIVGAFVDLLVGFSAAAADSKKKKKTAVATVVSGSDSMSTTTYYSSASSSFSSPSSPLSPHHS